MTINNSNLIYKVNELNGLINEHIKQWESCDKFFETLSKENEKQQSITKAFQGGHVPVIFKKITDFSLESYKNKYNELMNETKTAILDPLQILTAYDSLQQLMGLDDGLKKIESINDLFRKKIVFLLKDNINILLKSEYCGELETYFLPDGSNLKECHCSPEAGRVARNAFSRELLVQIKHKFPDKREIAIASIGAGGCLNELEIHALASKQGININHWSLIDPAMNKNRIANFATLTNWVTPNTTVLTFQETANKYFNKIKDDIKLPDVCLFIDISRDISDVSIETFRNQTTHRCLFASLSVFKDDFEFWLLNEK